MKRRLSILPVLCILVVSFLFLGMVNSDTIQANSIRLVGGGVDYPDHPHMMAMSRLAARLDARTGGEVYLSVYPSMQLGSAATLYDNVRKGTIDMAFLDMGWFAEINHEFNVLEAFYLFEDTDHFQEIVNTPGKLAYFENLLLEDQDLRVIMYLGGDERNIISTFPIEKIEDLRGRAMRSRELATALEWWELLGASPVPVAYPELYSALAAGVVEGSQNSPTAMIEARFVEPCSYVARTQHAVNFGAIVMNNTSFESLSSEHQDLLLEIGYEVQREIIQHAINNVEDQIKLIEEEHGLTITYPDLQPFIEASRKQLWDLAEEYDVVDIIEDIFVR